MGSLSPVLADGDISMTLRLGIMLAALALPSAVLPAAADPDPIDTVREFREAKERGDLSKARTFLAPDARIWFDMEERTGPGEPWTLEAGPWANWDRFFHSHTDLRDWRNEGGRVTAVGDETNDFYRLLDWKPKPVLLTYWVDVSGRLTGFMFHAVTGGPRVKSRLDEFEAWAKRTHPAELAYLMPNGKIEPSGDRPGRWRKILVEWRKAAGLSEVSLSDEEAGRTSVTPADRSR
jgi:hypothetical protein